MTALLPIPSHLPAWQAPHLAWLASRGHPTRYAVPDGIEPLRANLIGADLSGADLSGADLSGAYLRGAYLSGVYLRGAVLRVADLHRANLDEADLHGADLRGADLTGADLTGADLSEANLHGAVLRGADLCGAGGIAAIGPVGLHGRIIYAVAPDDGPMIQVGCWWGSVPDTIARIEADYADDPAVRDRYVTAVRAVAALVMP